MAGTLTISTLSDGTNSTSSTNCIQGSAKAWVNFNGSAATVTTNYNVSSITKTATGTYTVNFTNALTDANYSVIGSTYGARFTSVQNTGLNTSSAAYVQSLNLSGNGVDGPITYFAFYR